MVRHLFVFLVFGLLIFTPQAKASFLVEPYLGFALAGSGDQGTTDVSYSSLTYGGRVGYQFLGLMAGVDYSMQSPELEFETPGSATTNADYTKNQLGIFVGYELPFLLRAWGSYYLSSKLDQDFGSDPTEFSGNGFALGVGFTGLPFVSVNLEYRTFEYDEAKNNSGTSNLTGSSVINLSEILLSVSLPLNF